MRIEVSPSGRASCRGCKKAVAKGELRFAETYVIPGMDTEGTRYFHLSCAATKAAAGLQQALASYEGEIPERAALEEAINKSAAKGPGKTAPLPHADKAPTGRAKCMECREAIAKDSWRVAVEREIHAGAMQTTGAGYMHPGCALGWAGENSIDDTEAWIDTILANSGLPEKESAEVRQEIQDGGA